jgi:hypothetical protein
VRRSPPRRWLAARPLTSWLLAPIAALALIHTGAEARRDPPCGAPGKPACPLQEWMRNNLAVPYAKSDLSGLAKGLTQVVSFNPRPKKWGNWDKIASDGAAAARKGDKSRARLACTNCHKVYRRTYNFSHRQRPLGD